MINAEVSKAIGHEPRAVSWPKSVEEVKAATDYQVLEWHRFLPSPERGDTEKQAILNAVVDEFINRKA